MSHTSSLEVKPELHMGTRARARAHTYTHTWSPVHTQLRCVQKLICSELILKGLDGFNCIITHLLRSTHRPTTHSEIKRHHFLGKHFKARDQKWSVFIGKTVLSGHLHFDSVGRIYTSGINTCRRYILFLLLCHVLLQTLCLCSFSASCDYINVFLYLPSGFQLLLLAWLRVCCLCPFRF